MSAAIILALASLVGAPTPGTPASPDPKLAELVKKLGSKSYRTREGAARDLLSMGAASLSALTAGTKDTDPEVAERCRQLLPQAAAKERNEKIAALTADAKSPLPKGLAGLDRFIKVTGDNKEAREMFAELMANHHETIEAAETDPKKATERFRQFCNDAYNKWYAGINAGRVNYDTVFNGRSDITYFLFMASDSRIRGGNDPAQQAYSLLYGNQVINAIAEKDGSPAIRKIFVNWLEVESNPNLVQRTFQIAAQVNLKEALPAALKQLERKETQSYGKAYVILALSKLGSKEHIPKLQPLLEDKTSLGTINFGGGGKPLTTQTRDVALAVSVMLAGQKLTDYGFDGRYANSGGQSYHYYGFPEDKDRDAAHTKWKEWAKANLDKKK